MSLQADAPPAYPPLLGLIDYGVGNLRSVEKALQKVGARVEIVNQGSNLASCDGAILPGVGAFREAMEQLRDRGFEQAITRYVEAQKPLLGICLGLQLIFEESDEYGVTPGLGLVPGRVTRLETSLKIPHIGWNTAVPTRSDPLLEGLSESSYYYFVHSYAPVPRYGDDILCQTTYGTPFTSAVRHGSIAAFQFHPEKSSSAGLTLLKNFVGEVARTNATLSETAA